MSTDKSWIGEDGSAVHLYVVYGEIRLEVEDGTGDGVAVSLDGDEPMEILQHLNRLLGNPLSSAPFAG